MNDTGATSCDLEEVPCDCCGSTSGAEILRQKDLLFEVTQDEFSIVRCLQCGLVFLNPRPSRRSIGAYYPAVYYPPVAAKDRRAGPDHPPRWSARIKRWVLEDYYGYPVREPAAIPRPIRRLLLWPEKHWRELRGRHALPWRGEGKVLDVGCGAGGNLHILQEQGWTVFGIEISETAASHARALTGGEIHAGTLESAPFADKMFDLILMSHSLEHLPSPTHALLTVRRLLKDDGVLLITVPNLGSFEAALFGPWWFHWDPPRHFYHFDRRTLLRLLKQSGFREHLTRTGVGSTFFMASLERFWAHRFRRALPLRKLVDRIVAKPVCLIAGHAGYGTELTIVATKSVPESASRESGGSS